MTDTARDPRITDLIGFAAGNTPVEFQNTFNDIVSDRLAIAIDAKKIELAKDVFNDEPEIEPEAEEPQEEEEETDGEESTSDPSDS